MFQANLILWMHFRLCLCEIHHLHSTVHTFKMYSGSANGTFAQKKKRVVDVMSRDLVITLRDLDVTVRELDVTCMSRELDVTWRNLDVTSRHLDVTSIHLDISPGFLS